MQILTTEVRNLTDHNMESFCDTTTREEIITHADEYETLTHAYTHHKNKNNKHDEYCERRGVIHNYTHSHKNGKLMS